MPGLFASPPQISPSGVLSFTPAAGAEGTAVIPVRLADDGGTANGGVATSGPVSLTVAVDAVDASPTISLLRRLRSADGRGTLSLLVGDDGPTADLDLTGTASRDGVRLLLDGDGADRRVVFSGLPAGPAPSSRCGSPTAPPRPPCASGSPGAPPAPTPCTEPTALTSCSAATATTVSLGASGADLLSGGRGDDVVRGGPGADLLRGGPGRDRLVGGPGQDLQVGGPGQDEEVQRGRPPYVGV